MRIRIEFTFESIMPLGNWKKDVDLRSNMLSIYIIKGVSETLWIRRENGKG